MFSRIVVPAAFFFAYSFPAPAAPVEDAFAHFEAVAAGDVERIVRGYADNAVLQWVGGPLDGVYYAERGGLREVWSRFAAGSGGPLKATVANTELSENPNGATVTANVEFQGKTAVKVRYVLVYRQGKVVNEIWQVDPNLNIGY
ncbi:MAG: nuclear transport factor 2 family protein [Pseudomonadota bacterium]